MIEFLQEILENAKCLKRDMILVVDRAYLSEDNIKKMDEANVDFLCILPENAKGKIKEHIIKTYAGKVKSRVNYIRETEQYAKVFDEDWLDRRRYFHVVWDADRDKEKRSQLMKEIDDLKEEVKNIIIKQTRLTQNEYNKYSKYLKLNADRYGQKSSGRGKPKYLYAVKSLEERISVIDKAAEESGFFVIVTSQKMEAEEALKAYNRREGIEKMFKALKSNMGMDKIGVHSDASIRAKTMIWFISLVFYSLLFKRAKYFKEINGTDISVPSMIRKLNNIKVDNKNTNYYVRSEPFDKKQNQTLEALKISLEEIDKDAKEISCP